uniref:Uncharacterized protein n=1 Tax=Magallana gigas TaxID=29159 RepID=K1R0Q7_MAGGI
MLVPPVRPRIIATAEDLRRYLQQLNQFYMILSRPRRLFFLFTYFMFFYYIFIAIFHSILRILASVIFGTFLLPRIDYSVLPRKCQIIDLGLPKHLPAMDFILELLEVPVDTNFTYTFILEECPKIFPHQEFRLFLLVPAGHSFPDKGSEMVRSK